MLRSGLTLEAALGIAFAADTLSDLEEGPAYLDSRAGRSAVAGGVGSRTAR